MKLQREEDILNLDFRAHVIKEIHSDENIARKEGIKKRYEIFKDYTSKYVKDRMKEELSTEVFKEIEPRTSNVSICRKMIDKKSMVFKGGALREVKDGQQPEELQSAIDFYVDELNHNTKMKKVNRYLELTKNVSYFVSPYSDPKEPDYYKIKSTVMLPHLYDVIEDADNPELPRVYIFSYFSDRQEAQRAALPNETGIRAARDGNVLNFRQGDMQDQAIADSPADAGAGNMHYIWWSHGYHFTTDKKGEIIKDLSPEDLLNPIGELPIVNYAKDQDGQFWAVGGDDLVEGSILINLLLTDMYFIAKLQGQGIFYLIGPEVPENLKVGPSDAIILKKKPEDPDAQIGFASSSPPLADHMAMIEQYVALLLSTNNLEPGTVRGELSATTAASGIQEMIRMSENIDDIEDQREIYRDNEPQIFRIIFKWHNLLSERGVLHPSYDRFFSLDTLFTMSLKFPETNKFMTDKEKLEIIEKRKDLGLDSQIDSMMRDDPDLSREDAEVKLKRLLEEKLIFQQMKMKQLAMPQEKSQDKEEEEVKDALQEEEEETQKEIN